MGGTSQTNKMSYRCGIKYLLPALLLLAGCATGPEPGNIYENRLTGERIEIDSVGVCGELLAYYESIPEDQLAAGPVMNATDSTGTCFSYRTEDVRAYVTIPITSIESVSELQGV